MATKNIVPRITNEGKLGKPDKRWAQGNFSTGSFGLISGSLIPDAQESHNLGEAARPWKEIFVSTSSIKFVNPADNSVLQSLAATDVGFEYYLQGNIMKYLWRYRYKNGVEDLKKAEWYLKALIEEQESWEGKSNGRRS